MFGSLQDGGVTPEGYRLYLARMEAALDTAASDIWADGADTAKEDAAAAGMGRGSGSGGRGGRGRGEEYLRRKRRVAVARDAMQSQEEACSIYESYTDLKRSHGVLDFTDMITRYVLLALNLCLPSTNEISRT